MAVPFKPPIPATIRIGHIRYDITVSNNEINKADSDARRNYAGFSHASEQRIVIREDMGADYTAETLLHEILHQCLRVAGVDPDADAKAGLEDVEERTVGAIAGPLLGALRSHPDLVACLTAQAG